MPVVHCSSIFSSTSSRCVHTPVVGAHAYTHSSVLLHPLSANTSHLGQPFTKQIKPTIHSTAEAAMVLGLKNGAGTIRSCRFRHLSLILASLSFLTTTNLGHSQLRGDSDKLDDWVQTTVQTQFEGEVKEIVAVEKLMKTRKLQQRARQVDEFVTTKLTEEIKGRLTEEILTRLREDRDPESIFEFENDACK